MDELWQPRCIKEAMRNASEILLFRFSTPRDDLSMDSNQCIRQDQVSKQMTTTLAQFKNLITQLKTADNWTIDDGYGRLPNSRWINVVRTSFSVAGSGCFA